MRIVLVPFLLFSFLFINAQTVPSSIANWKNDALGAYSIIHDDYGAATVDGIWQYADTIASNRGLKFTFGAISSNCEIARNIKGYSNPYEYAKNVMMAQHGHEIINHSHTHTCAVNRGWGDCSSTGWGEIKGSAAWNTELIQSNNSITSNTGHAPKYFIYPYDQFTDLANTELEALGYIGSRSGWHVDGIHTPFYKWGYEENDENLFKPNSTGFFRTSVQVFDNVDAAKNENDQVTELNTPVDDAITNYGWANRELHNVGWSGWGYVRVNAYRRHLNYVKQKVDAGELWMGTVSEILTYQIQKLIYNPSANFDLASKKVTVTFTEDKSEVNVDVANYLAPLTIKTPITVKLDISAYAGAMDFSNIIVKQEATTITDVALNGNTLLINLYPNEGSFTIESSLPTGIVTANAQNNITLFPNPASTTLFFAGSRVWKTMVFDTKGSLVLNGSSNRLDISSLPEGVYFIRVNNSIATQRFVKVK